MKDMKDYFGYKVNPDGEVFNRRGKQLKTRITDKGYVTVTLTLNGIRTTKHIHRLLAECFLEKFEGAVEVDHINCVRDDNRLCNLRWVTKEQNVQHSYDSGNRNVVGVRNANCKTDSETVHSICKLLAQKLSPAKIRDLGFPYGLVRSIKSKKNWSSISDEYFT